MAEVRRRNTSVFLSSGAGGTSAVDFTAVLPNPIVVDEFTEVALAGLALDYTQKINVTAGGNEITMQFTGSGTVFSGFVAPGEYSPAELALAVQETLNGLRGVDKTPGLNSSFGSFRCSFDKSLKQFTISYKIPAGQLELTKNQVSGWVAGAASQTYTNKTGSDPSKWVVSGVVDPADDRANLIVNSPLATQSARYYCKIPLGVDTLLGMFPGVRPPAKGGMPTPPFAVQWDSTAMEFTPLIRGAPGASVGYAGTEDLVLGAFKEGGEIVFAFLDSDVDPKVVAMTEIARVALEPGDFPAGNLQTPQIFLGMIAFGDGTWEGFHATADPFDTSATIEVDGEEVEIPHSSESSKLLENDPEYHARVLGSAIELGAGPSWFLPFPSTGRKVTFEIPAGSEMGAFLGFKVGIGFSKTSNYDWTSTEEVKFSLDSSGIPSAIYVTSSALNTGSIYRAPGVSSSPFILGSAPAVGQIFSKDTHTEFNPPAPFYNTLVLGGRQKLGSIDIQVRDSFLRIVAPPTDSTNACAVQLRFRNHPVV